LYNWNRFFASLVSFL